VDEKGRVKIPSAFLDTLKEWGERFYVTSENGDYVRIYPMKVWNGIEDKLAQLSSHNPTKRKFLARTNYYGQVVRMDDQGRLLIPQLLRDAASLVGDVAVMGIEKRLVVANDARLRAQITEHPATDEDIESLGVVGL